MRARNIQSEAFDREVVDSERPTLVDFHADWCGPCRVMEPLVEELANQFEGSTNVVKVNVDDAPEIARRYGVQSIPTFIVVRNGVMAQKLVGIQSRQALTAAIAV